MYGARARVCMRAGVLQVRAPAPACVFCPTCSCLCPDCPVGTDIGLVRAQVVHLAPPWYVRLNTRSSAASGVFGMRRGVRGGV